MRAACVSVAGAVVFCLSTACGSSTPVSATPSITQNFSGTVQPGGSDTNNFTVTQYGEVDITVTSLGPPATIQEGLAIGSVVGGACSPGSVAQGPVNAATTPQFVNPLNAGAYCVTVYDIGNQAGPVQYALTVLHP